MVAKRKTAAHPFDIAAYQYRADIYTPDELIEALIADGVASPGARGMSAEEVLDQIAGANAIDRDDEYSFDSDDFPKIVFRDEYENYLDEVKREQGYYAKRSASRRRKQAVEAREVTTGPWEKSVAQEEGSAYNPDFVLDGWTGYASRPVYVNGEHVANHRIDLSYGVVLASDDPSVNPDRLYPMDLTYVEWGPNDEAPEGVMFDVTEVIYEGLETVDGSELGSGDYNYGDGAYHWFSTLDRAMAEAKRLAEASLSWLDENDAISPNLLSSL